MYQNDNPKIRIQATVIDIISYDVRHIRVVSEPILNEEYTIVLDDCLSQAERYALYIMDKFGLIDFLFPTIPPEPSDITISAKIQKYISVDSFALCLTLI